MESYHTRQAQNNIIPPPLNYRRGIFFLRLAVEQIRSVNSACAERILREYLEPLDAAFCDTVRYIDYSQFDRASQAFSYQQQNHGDKSWNSLEQRGQLLLAPPGFGLDTLGLNEAVPHTQSNQASTHEFQFVDPHNSLFSLKSRIEQLNHYGGPEAYKYLAVQPVRTKQPGQYGGQGANRQVSEPTRTEQINHFGGPNANRQVAVPTRSGTGAPNSKPSGSIHAPWNDHGPIGPPPKPSEVLAARRARCSASATFTPDVPPTVSHLPAGGSRSLFKWDYHPDQSHQQSTATSTPIGTKYPRGVALPINAGHLPGQSHQQSTATSTPLKKKYSSAVAIPFKAGRKPTAPSTGEVWGTQSSTSETYYRPQFSSNRSQGRPRYNILFGSFQENVEPESVAESSINSNDGKSCGSSFRTKWDSEDNEARAAEQFKASVESRDNGARAASSNWTEIAVTKPSSEREDHPHITFTPASPTARLSLPVGPIASVTPKEPAAAQLRVVWLSNLPKFFTLHHVSSQITEGPVMSILLQDNFHEALPGLSACIVFLNATDAVTYLRNNNHCPKTDKRLGPSKYAFYFHKNNQPNLGLTVAKPLSITDLKRTDITIRRGDPYAIADDNHLESMFPPNSARRRLKWTRSRLFYDVSMKQFKRDIYKIVGSKDVVELFHFYNQGEATVVFASVFVAATCMAAFEHLRKEHLPRWSAISMSESQLTMLEEKGCAGGFHPGRMDDKKGRYAGVDVSFVRDFNESKPEKLWSQFGKDGRSRPGTQMPGFEGLFEGPDV